MTPDDRFAAARLRAAQARMTAQARRAARAAKGLDPFGRSLTPPPGRMSTGTVTAVETGKAYVDFGDGSPVRTTLPASLTVAVGDRVTVWVAGMARRDVLTVL